MIEAPITSLTKESLKDMGLDAKSILRSKNMFALGMVYYLFDRPLDYTEKFFEEKFGFKKVLLTTSCTDALEMCAMLADINPGDEVITGDDLYGGSYRMFTKIFENYGIKFHFINLTDAQNIRKYINTNTKLIWLETPTNPTMQIVDINNLLISGVMAI